MPKPSEFITPEDRVRKWKKLWGAPRLLDEAAAGEAFEEFQNGLVPRRMHKLFLKSFGVPKAQFGNRFFMDDSIYRDWDTNILGLVPSSLTHVEVTVIYGSPDKLEAHQMRGETRRTLRDIVIDDWQAACAIVRAETTTLFVFVEPKMRGCIVRTASESDADG